MNRRTSLKLLGSAALASTLPQQGPAANTCATLAGAQTEGPYWVDEGLNRSDVRIDPSDGSTRPGVPVALSIMVQEVSTASCAPLAGAKVDIWHCDATGIYSDKVENNSVGKKFLRGYQIADDNGAVLFTTIYPGWYSGRTVHIHVRVRTYSGTAVLDDFTAQIFFDDTLTDTVFAANAPYNTRPARDTRNNIDMVLTGTRNGSIVYAAMTANATGYNAAAIIGVNLKTAPAAVPIIAAGGVVNAASAVPGISPGAWTTVFGQNLATATRALTASDLVSNALPSSLSGVTVMVGSEAAFVEYVSPTQINFQAPSGAGAGAVAVTVTNASGSSNIVSVVGQPVLPGLFVAAGLSAKAGASLELYGTGFGSTTPAVLPGVVFQGAAPLTNSVTVTIGGSSATVSFAGLISTGVYQVNVVVPNLSAGVYPIVMLVAGIATQNNATLTVTT